MDGRPAVARRLAETFGLTAEDAGAKNNAALRHACDHGHLAVAMWLVKAFGLTAAARDIGGNLLLNTCANGHLETAQWLAAVFVLTAEDARAALRYACGNGHLAVAQWLVVAFGLTAADARAISTGALRATRPGDRPAVAQWLEETFGLAAEGSHGGDRSCPRKRRARRGPSGHAREDRAAAQGAADPLADEEVTAILGRMEDIGVEPRVPAPPKMDSARSRSPA